LTILGVWYFLVITRSSVGEPELEKLTLDSALEKRALTVAVFTI